MWKLSARTTSRLACALGCASAALAQSPDASPEPFKEDRNVAFVRVWNLCPKGYPNFRIEHSGAGAESSTWLSKVRWFDLNAYGQVSPGTHKFTVTNAETGKAVGAVDFSARAQEWRTIVIQPGENETPKVTVEEDTYDLAPETPTRVRLINAVSDTKAALSAVGNAAPLAKLDSAGSAPVEGVAPSVDQLTVSTTDGAGRQKRFLLRSNFTIGKRVSIILIRDRYDRLAARMMYDGYVNEGPLIPAGQQ